MAAPDISVVVVSWRTRELTLGCLDALEADAEESELEVEVLLVDNASGDGTVEAVARDHPEVQILEAERNLGFSAGCNLAIERARGRYVLLLNPDSTVAPGTLAAIVAFLDAHPRAGAAGACLLDPTGERQFSCGRFLTPFNQAAEVLGLTKVLPVRALRRFYTEAELGAEPRRVDWVVGACMAIRREALEATGPFDEQFFMYSEDEDLCYRAHRAGWEVWYMPHVRVEHVGGGSSSQASDRMRVAARTSQTRFIRKHRGRLSAALFRLLLGVAALKPWGSREGLRWGR